MPKGVVESFALDHEAVVAPYVRLAATHRLNEDDVPVQKYDIRFSQPNREYLTTGALHTLEHLLAVFLRQSAIADSVIDISPMGCRTGFYFIVRANLDIFKVADAIDEALTKTCEVQSLDDVPGRAKEQCGNWQDHDLEGAKVWAHRWLEGIAIKGICAYSV